MWPGVGITLATEQGVNPALYYTNQDVPIGTMANIQSSGPGGDYSITSYSWTGGTPYSGYTSNPANGPPPPSMSLAMNVVKTTSSYQFIVGPTNQEKYTITLNVTYKVGPEGKAAAGEAEVIFTSDAPQGSLSTAQVGTQSAGQLANGQFAVALYPGIRLDATTSTDMDTAGTFMFMQLINNTYTSSTNQAGQSFYAKNNYVAPDGQNYNGPIHDFANLAYSFYYAPPPAPPAQPAYYSSWSLGADESAPEIPGVATPEMSDIPRFADAPTDQVITATMSFSTYLMYMPATNGVWIAISQANWSWTETATVQGGVLVGPTSKQQAPTITTPGGASAFPSWVNTSTNFGGENMRPGAPGP